MTITRFEDIEAWQLARDLCKRIHRLACQEGLNRDFSIKDQIFRSSGSVMDNIAEGFDAGSTREFIRFLNYAKRSSTEVKSQLYRILDRNYCDEQTFQDLYDRTSIIRAKIGSFIKYLQALDSTPKQRNQHNRPTD